MERVVMLRNGETFQGVVTEAGDHLIITLPDGEISLKTSEVEAIFRTLDEGYLRQRNVLTPDAKADAHLDLAQWCLRHKLYERAAEEIEAARGADPRHPKIDFMQRKLKLVQEQPKAMVARTVSTATANDEPTNDDLDRFIRGVSTEAIETFAHSIQPLLLNNCTASSCHGPRSDTGLSLLRIQLGRTPSRRLTQRNLYAVCRFVDRENPNESPLLTQTIREHGAARAAIFTSRDMVQYKQLVGWVRMVAHAGGSSQPRSVRKDEQPLLQSVPSDDNTRLQRVDDQNEEPSADEQEAPGNIEQTTAESPVDEKESDDPFDAEIFNRRFGPKR
jgi:hypothetical protein